jgi:orotate phosphoribosyltransferase
MSDARSRLRAFLDSVILRGEFTLKSGKKSSYYLDGRLITLQAEPLALMAQVMLEITANDPVIAVGGPALGAIPIVGAVVHASAATKRPLKGFMVRSEPKDHGRGRLVEGPPLDKGAGVFLVEDVTTTGGSVLAAAHAVQAEYGVKVVRVVSLLDRQEGSADAFAAAGIPLTPIFTAAELGLKNIGQ